MIMKSVITLLCNGILAESFPLYSNVVLFSGVNLQHPHNDWDVVRTSKTVRKLRCRICSIANGPDFMMRLPTADWHHFKELGNVLNVNKKKLTLEERERLKAANKAAMHCNQSDADNQSLNKVPGRLKRDDDDPPTLIDPDQQTVHRNAHCKNGHDDWKRYQTPRGWKKLFCQTCASNGQTVTRKGHGRLGALDHLSKE